MKCDYGKSQSHWSVQYIGWSFELTTMQIGRYINHYKVIKYSCWIWTFVLIDESYIAYITKWKLVTLCLTQPKWLPKLRTKDNIQVLVTSNWRAFSGKILMYCLNIFHETISSGTLRAYTLCQLVSSLRQIHGGKGL